MEPGLSGQDSPKSLHPCSVILYLLHNFATKTKEKTPNPTPPPFQTYTPNTCPRSHITTYPLPCPTTHLHMHKHSPHKNTHTPSYTPTQKISTIPSESLKSHTPHKYPSSHITTYPPLPCPTNSPAHAQSLHPQKNTYSNTEKSVQKPSDTQITHTPHRYPSSHITTYLPLPCPATHLHMHKHCPYKHTHRHTHHHRKTLIRPSETQNHSNPKSHPHLPHRHHQIPSSSMLNNTPTHA